MHTLHMFYSNPVSGIAFTLNIQGFSLTRPTPKGFGLKLSIGRKILYTEYKRLNKNATVYFSIDKQGKGEIISLGILIYISYAYFAL